MNCLADYDYLDNGMKRTPAPHPTHPPTFDALSWNSCNLSRYYLTAARPITLHGAAARGALTFFETNQV